MKYLLLGNGKIKPSKRFDGFDAVVQFNHCRHRARVPAAALRWVFLSNTGSPMERNVDILCGLAADPVLRDAVIIEARSPRFYRFKRALLWLCRSPHWQHFTPSNAGRRLERLWPVQTIDFAASWRLERKMRRAGMPGFMMPSTGMIAFDWVCQRMQPGDSLHIDGFGWRGWEGHPWEIEQAMMRKVLGWRGVG